MRTALLSTLFTGWVALSGATGCGVMSAITNPKAGWALREPAPMAVILRRADAARATAASVERLLAATPVDATSKWIPKLAIKKADAEATLDVIGADPDYVVPKGAKLRVVQAEAWAKLLADTCPHESKFPSVMAQVSAELGTAYADIASQAKKVAKLKGDKADEEAALDKPDISSADREEHEKKKREIEEQLDKTEAEYKPKVEAFLAKVRELGPKATPEAKKQVPVALAVMKRAVDDAKVANSVALIRYPMAMPGMPQELKSQAKRIVADVIEDRTGHRPSLEKFDPDIKLEGGSPKLTLNGLPPDAMASLKPDALLGEVTNRSKDYVVKVLTLTPYIAETEEQLDLETEVIKALMDGLSVEEGKIEGAGDDLGELKVEVDDLSAAAAASGKGGKGGKSGRHPVPLAACGAKVVNDRAAKDDKDKTKSGKAPTAK
jgi:hypothetical protein